MKKLFIAGLFLLVVLVVASGCSPTDQVSASEAIKVSAEGMWSEFAADMDAAAKQFDGSLVTVTGMIAEVHEMFMGFPCILLENGVDSIPDGIFCYFPEGFNVHNYSVGETITVTGVCSLAIHVAGEETPFISIKNAEIAYSP